MMPIQVGALPAVPSAAAGGSPNILEGILGSVLQAVNYRNDPAVQYKNQQMQAELQKQQNEQYASTLKALESLLSLTPPNQAGAIRDQMNEILKKMILPRSNAPSVPPAGFEWLGPNPTDFRASAPAGAAGATGTAAPSAGTPGSTPIGAPYSPAGMFKPGAAGAPGGTGPGTSGGTAPSRESIIAGLMPGTSGYERGFENYVRGLPGWQGMDLRNLPPFYRQTLDALHQQWLTTQSNYLTALTNQQNQQHTLGKEALGDEERYAKVRGEIESSAAQPGADPDLIAKNVDQYNELVKDANKQLGRDAIPVISAQDKDRLVKRARQSFGAGQEAKATAKLKELRADYYAALDHGDYGRAKDIAAQYNSYLQAASGAVRSSKGSAPDFGAPLNAARDIKEAETRFERMHRPRVQGYTGGPASPQEIFTVQGTDGNNYTVRASYNKHGEITGYDVQTPHGWEHHTVEWFDKISGTSLKSEFTQDKYNDAINSVRRGFIANEQDSPQQRKALDKRIVDYIAVARAGRMSPDQIRQNLIEAYIGSQPREAQSKPETRKSAETFVNQYLPREQTGQSGGQGTGRPSQQSGNPTQQPPDSFKATASSAPAEWNGRLWFWDGRQWLWKAK